MENESCSLFQSFRHRILNEIIDETRSLSSSFIIIVDSKSLGILSGAVRVIDLTERGATVIELLEKERKPLPNMDALYFLTPSIKSIKRLIQDFSSEPKYHQLFIYFTGHITDQLMQEIAHSEVVKYIRVFKEANCAFRMIGSDCFSLECPGILGHLYMSKSSSERRELINYLAQNLAGVCGILHDLPYVCYQSDSLPAQELALAFEEHVENLFRSVTDLKANESRPVMIILDRNYDLSLPLIHDVHYEALLKDLYEVANDGQVIYSSVDNSNVSSTKEAVINEHDEIWVKLRYQEIDEAQSVLNNELKAFRLANAGMEQAAKGEGLNEVKAMAKVVSGLSGFNETITYFATHRFLIEACMKIFADEKITDISEIEQMLLCGFDTEKKEYKESEVIEKIINKLSDIRKGNEQFRLAFLTIAAMELSANDRRSLTDVIPPSLGLALSKVSLFGLSLQGAGKTQKRISKKKIGEVAGRIPPVTKIFNYAIPRITEIIESAISNTLEKSGFTFARNSPPNMGEAQPVPQVKSLRKKQNPGIRSKRKVIVFVLGGVSYAELRVLKDFTDVQVIIGGSRAFCPLEFVQEILDMSKEAEIPDLDPRDIELDFR